MPETPVADQYRTSGNLRARGGLHARYANRNWFDWVGAQLELTPDRDVLDIGCGAGWFWLSAGNSCPSGLRLTLTDNSAGMVSEAIANLERDGRIPSLTGKTCDAADLPFADASFDAAIAMHMLYHVEDAGRALDEMARVLRPGGLAAVTTNGEDNLGALFDLGSRAFGGAPRDPAARIFGPGRALELFGERFDDVALHRFQDVYVITDADDIVQYLTSYPPGNRAGEAEITAVGRLVAARLDEAGGVLNVAREAVLVCGRARDTRPAR